MYNRNRIECKKLFNFGIFLLGQDVQRNERKKSETGSRKDQKLGLELGLSDVVVLPTRLSAPKTMFNLKITMLRTLKEVCHFKHAKFQGFLPCKQINY